MRRPSTVLTDITQADADQILACHEAEQKYYCISCSPTIKPRDRRPGRPADHSQNILNVSPKPISGPGSTAHVNQDQDVHLPFLAYTSVLIYSKGSCPKWVVTSRQLTDQTGLPFTKNRSYRVEFKSIR